jgi:hypothetical protein
MVEDLSGVVERHELALQHHRSAVRDTVHHIQVVRDQDVGQAQLGLQLAQQRQNFLGHQRIERGGGLVQDDHVGLGCQRPGNAYPLLLPAGQLPRAALQEVLRQFDQFHQLLARQRFGGGPGRNRTAPAGPRCRAGSGAG